MKYLKIIKSAYQSRTPLSAVLSAEELRTMSHSADFEIRCWLAKALAFDIGSNDSCAILCFLSGDHDSLVRTEAVDSLSGYIDPSAYQCLRTAATDSNELVRAYAAYGIAAVGQKVAPVDARRFLYEMLKTEKCDRVRVGVLQALYFLGETSHLSELLQLFGSDDYWVRCSVIQALYEIADITNCAALASFVKNIDLSYEPPAVMSSAERLLELLAYLQFGD